MAIVVCRETPSRAGDVDGLGDDDGFEDDVNRASCDAVMGS